MQNNNIIQLKQKINKHLIYTYVYIFIWFYKYKENYETIQPYHLHWLPWKERKLNWLGLQGKSINFVYIPILFELFQ